MVVSPLGDQGVDVHQGHEQGVWLVESWLLAVHADHEGTKQSLMAESTLATLNESLVDI